jgi:hypothetical protein
MTLGGNMAHINWTCEAVGELTDIHHPHHPLHHLVLHELEGWPAIDEGLPNFPVSPEELHALERGGLAARQPTERASAKRLAT